jgi:hypothetical protein
VKPRVRGIGVQGVQRHALDLECVQVSAPAHDGARERPG